MNTYRQLFNNIRKVYIKLNVYFIYITYLIYLLIYNDQFSVFYHI